MILTNLLYFELNLAVWGELQFKSNQIKSNEFMPMIKQFFFREYNIET